ncbi:MAG TPA: hypothetical protein VGS21_04615, partial [Acidimicrobiales bacterium]|nr:hypothetical protein [Acidimicrobiales bacterium]
MRRVSVIGLLTLACLVAIASPAGADWKQQPVPAPSGAVTGNMNGVWCPTTTTCTAVGSYSGSSGTQPLAEVSTNGASWAIQSVPVPSGATTAELNAVNCQPNGQCTAVGDYTDGAGQHPLIETRAGSTWTIQSAPQPAGTAAAQLVGVSCTSTSSCDAVGSSTSGSATAALLETLSAGTWSIASLPLPSGTTTSSLGGVSCPTAGFCVVAGTASPGSGQNALAETWNGTSWTIQTIPSPPGATATSLDAVSCSSPTACFVVGAHQADRFNGTSWKSLYVPTPGPHTGLTDLTGVACPVATRCYSAGFYYVDGVETAITEIWNGAKWAADGPAITASNDSSGMSAIACSDDTLCASVGWYHDPTNGNQLLIDSFELRWQQQTVTAPSGAIASNMTAVSCTSPTACMAVDQFEGSGSTFGTSAQQWNGGSWTDIATPNSANSVLSGISCAKTMCMAVGDVNNAGNIVPVAEQWNGSSWTVESVPAPAAAASSYLLADSCVSTTSCVAVGEYRDSSGNQYTLADSW